MGRSDNWLEKLKKQLQEMPQAGLGEVHLEYLDALLQWHITPQSYEVLNCVSCSLPMTQA